MSLSFLFRYLSKSILLLLFCLLFDFSIFGQDNKNKKPTGDVCFVFVIDEIKATELQEKIDEIDDENKLKELAKGIVKEFPKFETKIGEEENTFKLYPFPNSKFKIFASVFYTDESLLSYGDKPNLKNSNSVTLTLALIKNKVADIESYVFQKNDTLYKTELTYNKHNNISETRFHTFVNGRRYLIGLNCDYKAKSQEKKTEQSFYGTTDLKTFREGRDKEFRDKDKSPLKEVDFPNYESLSYFPINNKLRIESDFEKTNDEKILLIPTSAGKVKRYVKYGILKFEIDKKKYTLNVYRTDKKTREKYPEYKDLLFIPFKDLTNGKGSYGSGRYLYILDTNKKKVILDFNLASNPSCAYGSDRYSCPIPPRNNQLQIEIKAGEKSYDYSK